MDSRRVGHAIRRRVGAPANTADSAVYADEQASTCTAYEHERGMCRHFQEPGPAIRGAS